MKKLLILLSLTMAISAFGAPKGNTEKTSDMTVTATVIQPLTVIATDMEFGQIIQGNKTSATSKYDITGEKGQAITIEIPTSVELTSTNGEKMTATIEYRNLPTSIGINGASTAAVDGHLDVSSDQAVGNYSGTLTARVQYQ